VAFRSFCVQSRCAAQVSLVSEYHEKFRLLASDSMFNNPRRDLKVERVVPWLAVTVRRRLNASAKDAVFRYDLCAFGDSSAIIFRRTRSTLAIRTQRADSFCDSDAGGDEQE
jgi:hypothetical protein